MKIQKKSILTSFLGLFLINTSYAVTMPNWIPAENMLSQRDAITAMATYHDHVYIAGLNSQFDRLDNSFVYAYQNLNNWLPVNMGLQTPEKRSVYVKSLLVFQDKLYAGGWSGFYVYNGDDAHPNWMALSMQGLSPRMPVLSHLVAFQNKIYAIAVEGDGGHIGIYVYNTVTRSWAHVSARVPVQSDKVTPATSLIVSNNKLYWLYNFVDYPAHDYHGMIYVYNGDDAHPNWDEVYKSDDARSLVAMDVFNNTLIVAGNMSARTGHKGSGFVLAYNSNDKLPQWTDISGSARVLNNISISTLAHDATNLYVGGATNTDDSPCASIYQFNNDFKHGMWSESDQGIQQRCIGAGRNTSDIIGFALTTQGLFVADFGTNYQRMGSVVYFNNGPGLLKTT